MPRTSSRPAGWRRPGSRSRATASATCSAAAAPPSVWCGSHLDSVPTAGRFDGALGVVAAIEAAGGLPDAPLAVVAFRSEESGPAGSRRLRLCPEAYLELHIEQGPVLERLGEPIGIVTAIAGQARGSATFTGRADHAGTTPMDVREDALVAAATFVLHVRDCARDGARATVGADRGRAERDQRRAGAGHGLGRCTGARGAALGALIDAIGFEPDWRLDPVPMSGAPLEALRAAAPGAPELVSGAGHDAMFIGRRGGASRRCSSSAR